MSDGLEQFERLLNKEQLQFSLSFIALYIGVFEFMKDSLQNNVEWFLCADSERQADGTIIYKHNETYRREIERRIVDGKGIKDRFRNTMLWFKENGAISDEDYLKFLKIRSLRNSFTHEMTRHASAGITDEDVQSLFGLFDLYSKIEKWWIKEIELPISGKFPADGISDEDVESGALIIFKMMLNSLFGGKSDEYMEMIKALRNKYSDQNE